MIGIIVRSRSGGGGEKSTRTVMEADAHPKALKGRESRLRGPHERWLMSKPMINRREQRCMVKINVSWS